MFHEHKNTKLIHFSSISQKTIFRVLQLTTQPYSLEKPFIQGDTLPPYPLKVVATL